MTIDGCEPPGRGPRRLARAAGSVAVAALMILGLPACGDTILDLFRAEPPPGALTKDAPPVIETTPVPLNMAAPDETQVGRLRYRGGLSLSSEDRRFGGLSGLTVSPDGTRFIAVADVGYWVHGSLVYDDAHDLAGVAEVQIEPMRGLDGRYLSGHRHRDAESVTRMPDGSLIVAFERDHRLWAYAEPGATPTALTQPDGLSAAPLNEGVEALATLPDGRLLAITEGLFHEPDTVVGWVQDGAGGWDKLFYQVGGGFRPTGATVLPDGDVLILERRFPPVGARVRRFPATDAVAGATISAREIARLEGALTVDNMEGLSARQTADGTVLIYMLSDDNFRPIQRTLLMMFELLD
ncbi:MAG: esterase-like activity of phytase family protein [Rhodospirillales bacterium]|nr:MAG: esterase-like activity of phytase family protein [Rhodospirillales bacterium]